MSVGWSQDGEKGQAGGGGFTINHFVISLVLEFILPKDRLVGPQLAVYQNYKQKLDQGRFGE